jgi:hypothetical protein
MTMKCEAFICIFVGNNIILINKQQQKDAFQLQIHSNSKRVLRKLCTFTGYFIWNIFFIELTYMGIRLIWCPINVTVKQETINGKKQYIIE